MPENAGEKQVKPGAWKPGQSGNPKGKKPGTRHQATRLAETLLDGEAKAITRKAVELALQGDQTALRLCMERLLPPRKGRPVNFALPPIATMKDVAKAHDALLAAVAAGDLTPDEAAALLPILNSKLKTIEAGEIAERLTHLESVMEVTR